MLFEFQGHNTFLKIVTICHRFFTGKNIDVRNALNLNKKKKADLFLTEVYHWNEWVLHNRTASFNIVGRFDIGGI